MTSSSHIQYHHHWKPCFCRGKTTSSLRLEGSCWLIIELKGNLSFNTVFWGWLCTEQEAGCNGCTEWEAPLAALLFVTKWMEEHKSCKTRQVQVPGRGEGRSAAKQRGLAPTLAVLFLPSTPHTPIKGIIYQDEWETCTPSDRVSLNYLTSIFIQEERAGTSFN